MGFFFKESEKEGEKRKENQNVNWTAYQWVNFYIGFPVLVGISYFLVFK